MLLFQTTMNCNKTKRNTFIKKRGILTMIKGILKMKLPMMISIMLVMILNINHIGDGGGDDNEELTLKEVGR